MKLKWIVACLSLFSFIPILFSGPLFLFCCPLYAASNSTSSAKTMRMHKSKSLIHELKCDKKPPIHRLKTVKHQNRPMHTVHGIKPIEKHILALLPPIRVCTPDLRIMLEMTQNVGRAMPNPCNPIWPMPIALSAGLNVDGKWGSLNSNIMGANLEPVSANDAYINILAIANYWMNGFASVSMGNPTIRSNPARDGRLGAAEYSAAYSNNIAGSNVTTIHLEQAFVTIGNPRCFPIFLQAGKQFQDYGRYRIHPITRTMTQVMSEALAVSAKLGWIYNKFYGSIYTLENRIARFDHAPSNRGNYGAALGYDQPICPGVCFRWDVGAAYLYNLIGVNDIAYNVVNFTKSDHYHRRTGGTSLYADIYDGPFTLHGRYTVAIQRFNEFDLPRHGVADFSGNDINGSLLPGKQGAKPWAVDFLATYCFIALSDRPQSFYLGFQVSRQASALNLPRNRYLVGYNIGIWHATNLGIEWDHDIAYSFSNGGSGNNSNLVTLRAAVQLS